MLVKLLENLPGAAKRPPAQAVNVATAPVRDVFDVIELPPPPLRTTGVEEQLADAAVQAYLMKGQMIKGYLTRLSRAEEVLRLKFDGDADARDISFSELRYLKFVNPLPVTQGPHPLEERAGAVEMPSPLQTFKVVFKDGTTISSETRSSFVDQDALHLFQAENDSEVTRIFVPLQVVAQHQIGPMLGEAMVEYQQAREEDIQAAVASQEKQRNKKIGEYLQDSIPLTAEQLRIALDEQTDRTLGLDNAPLPRLGQILVEENVITEDQLEAALAQQSRDRGKKLGEILEESGLVSHTAVCVTLARKLGVPFVKLKKIQTDQDAIDAVPLDLARKYCCLPLFIYRSRLVVAVDDPANTDAIDAVRFVSGRNLEVVVATRKEILEQLELLGGTANDSSAAEDLERELELELDLDTYQSKDVELKEAERLCSEKPIVRLVDSIILDAVQRRASDIHIRPLKDNVDLLLRIDGSLVKVRTFSKGLLPAVVSRIKIISRLDIAERRMPQDGRTRISGDHFVVDLRVSIIPTVSGESVVIRVLNTEEGLKSIREIGFSERDENVFRDLIHKSYGMILVTGPTGSGKSTTLYAALQDVQKTNVNVITVEDPVEYHMEGMEQIQVNARTGFTFAKALRHILRHDPDAIMVGELRDEETAKVAGQAALTGHLVLSTLHTNNAASAVTRLIDMDLEPFLLRSALLGVLAQRLVRRNCPHCLAEESVDPLMRDSLSITEDEVFYRGTGCENCNDTGYSGRIAVYELLSVTAEIRAALRPNVAADEIHQLAVEGGMVALTENALAQARQGKTSLAEVYRVRQD